MGLPIRKAEQHFTYQDYRQWPDDERWELIDGVAYSMGSPTTTHQTISMELSLAFGQFLKGKPCRIFAAPFDVLFARLNEQDEDDVDTIVQPDLLVVCDPTKIRAKYVWGAPDLVVEILSPSTSRKDQHEKYALYERSGVKEYWVIDPTGQWVQQYVLGADGHYAPEVTWVKTGTLVSTALPGFELDIGSIWGDAVQ